MVGVQHFSHFLLTMLLVDKLKDSAPSRIVYTSSASEATAQKEIPWDNLG
jgi:NAD(P)-dependent dehydrogenase (short-subunit alcohol dehydrogenase family)